MILRNPGNGERVPYFSIILISEGGGELKGDFSDYQISKGAILFLSPFQPFMIDGTTLKGMMINFHPDFFCIFKEMLKSTTSLPPDQGTASANLLRQLKEMIELHFKTKHSGGEYAELLNISLKKLGRIVKNHFQRTLTEIISERIVMEAKRELRLTSKTVKEIAYDLGFKDEYHFSRYFKNKTKVSPQLFRNSLRNPHDNYSFPKTGTWEKNPSF